MCIGGKKRLCTTMSLRTKPPKAHDSYSFTKFFGEQRENEERKAVHIGIWEQEEEKPSFFLLLLSHKQLFWTPLSLGILCPTWVRCTWTNKGLRGCRSAFPLAIEENVHFNWVPIESWWRLSQSPALTDGSLFLPSPAVMLGRTGRAAAV